MSSPKWPIVVFDLDGTLVNTIGLIIASYEHALSDVLNVSPNEGEARSWIGEPLLTTFSLRYPERAQELVDSYIAWNIAHLDELLEDYPGVAELLRAVAGSGAKIGVATSKRRSSAVRTVDAAGLSGLLEVTVAMEDTTAHKPSPEPLRLAVQRLGGRVEDAVYVGDAVVDVAAAHAAGMSAIAVSWGAGERDALAAAQPLVIVDTVAELQELLLS